MHVIELTLFALLSLHAHISTAFIAYECGGAESNYTSISLVDVGDCKTENEPLEEEEVVIQLLQPRNSQEVWARACKVEVNYIVFHCGMHSHNSIVKGGIISRVLTLSKSQCMDMHKERSATFYGTKISGLLINDTVSISVNFAGWASSDGTCEAAEFADGNTNWGRVTATGSIRISLYEFTARIQIDKREVRLPSGTVCQSDGSRCIDNDHGPTFWDAFSINDCQRNSFHVLYRGAATRVRSVRRRDGETVVSVYTAKTENNVFTLSSDRTQPFCFMHLGITEHPKLFVHEVKNENYYFDQDRDNALDLDLFMYVNAKFVHLEHSIASQMSRMYAELVQHRCEMDRRILATKLSMATIAPMEFAYEYMKGPGYTASILGESVYIVACTPVDVVSVQTDECTLEMPVSYKNSTLYMRPRSRILQHSGTPIACDGVLQPKYRLNGQWFATTPSLHASNNPQVLRPDSSGSWTYVSAGKLAKAGIYTPSQMERLREQIMSPIERRTKGERFAGLLNSEHVNMAGLNLNAVHNEIMIESKIKAFWESTWGFAMSFGTLSAGLLGVVFIFKLTKFLFDTFIHAVTLREVYGCTWHIMGAIWDALTTYLLTRVAKNRTYASTSTGGHVLNVYSPMIQPNAPPHQGDATYTTPRCATPKENTHHVYPTLPTISVTRPPLARRGPVTEITIEGVDVN